MPVINGIGQSDNTPIKQHAVRSIFATHMDIIKQINRKRANWVNLDHYLYIDLNAGSGRYNGHEGSPIIFLDEAKKRLQGFETGCYLCEIDKNNFTELLTNLKPYCINKLDHDNQTSQAKMRLLSGGIVSLQNTNNRDWVVCADLTETLKPMKKTFGLVYSDPNNHEANFDGLSTLFQKVSLKTTDLLIHVSATTIKRVSCVKENVDRINKGIGKIDKKCWLIRRPITAQQWVFLLGTNWPGFPEFRELGFVDLDSKEGQNILCYVSNTIKEINSSQKKTIHPMVNTYNTQNLRLFGALS